MSSSIVVYTDGACSGNPGPSGLGVYLEFRGVKRYISEYLGEGTNNSAELTALLRALQVIKDPTHTTVIYTDSSYVIGVLTKGWKIKKNRELISSIKGAMRRFSHLTLKKVAGHAGVEGNEIADELARTAITTRSSTSRYETPPPPQAP